MWRFCWHNIGADAMFAPTPQQHPSSRSTSLAAAGCSPHSASVCRCGSWWQTACQEGGHATALLALQRSHTCTPNSGFMLLSKPHQEVVEQEDAGCRHRGTRKAGGGPKIFSFHCACRALQWRRPPQQRLLNSGTVNSQARRPHTPHHLRPALASMAASSRALHGLSPRAELDERRQAAAAYQPDRSCSGSTQTRLQPHAAELRSAM